MGLISTISDIGSTAANIGGLAVNAISSVGKQLGISSLGTAQDFMDNITGSDISPNKAGYADIRGSASVFRSQNISYASNNGGIPNFNHTFYMNNGDYYWTQNMYKSNNDYSPIVRKIILSQFQPYQQTFIGQLAASLKGAKNSADKQNLANALRDFLDSFASNGTKSGNSAIGTQIGKTARNGMIARYSKDPSALYNNNLTISLVNPWQAIKRLYIQGHWINTYQIPLIFNDTATETMTYLSSDNKNAFSIGGFGGAVGGSISSDENKKYLNQSSNSSTNAAVMNTLANIPSTPTQNNSIYGKISDTGSTRTITTTFYLINKTSVHTLRNYIFLHILSAGTYKVQLPVGMVQCPNVYHLQIPGFTEMVWCTMDITVAEIGKLRRDYVVVQNLQKYTDSKLYGNDKLKQQFFWPEAWKLTINFYDFTPRTFNSYQHYLTHGSCLESLRKQEQTTLAQQIEGLKSQTLK